jgi:hypothetical protein
MANELTYAIVEVGGIQNYILSTGKLREMIGGSQLIEDLSKGSLERECKALNLDLIEPQNATEPTGNKVLALQRNAGEIHLLFSSREIAKKFISHFIFKISSDYPGIPLFGALNDEEHNCTWTDKDSYRQCRASAQKGITKLRNNAPVNTGMSMLPLCQMAGLDGLPAVDRIGDDFISVCSKSRQSRDLLEAADERLRQRFETVLPSEVKVIWTDDIEELAGSGDKIAYIHIDGNDLGKLFRSFLESDDYKNLNVQDSIKAMADLSKLVENSTRKAMDEGLKAIMSYEYEVKVWQEKGRNKLVVPARPLVQGGDDVTIVMRADLALLFISRFVNTFEKEAVCKLSNKEIQLSVGAGMVICQKGYPFIRAFNLSEELLKNAKELTKDEAVRPSSLDYLVITNEVENDLELIRHHIAKTADKKTMLTAKPLVLSHNNLHNFVDKGLKVLTKLPRSTVRPALNQCRKGKDESKSAFETLERNIRRQLGGRADSKLMTHDEFKSVFPDNSFFTTVHKEIAGKSVEATYVGDWLELAHLLPNYHDERSYSVRVERYLALLKDGEEK